MSTFSSPEAWVILNSIEKTIEEKIIKNGIPLKKWDIQINYGIKTGFNDAFIITDEKRKELIKTDPKSEQIIRPLLRGRDIKRYSYDFADIFLITTFPSLNIDIELYPAVKEHLMSFGYDRLKQTGENNSRKKTSNKWFETQDSIGYWEDFYKQKIVWKRVGSILRFSYDETGAMALDSTCFATGRYIKFLVCFLNSKMGAYLMKDSPQTGTGDLLISVQAIEPLKIPLPSDKLDKTFELLLDSILNDKRKGKKNQVEIEQKINQYIYDLYQLTSDEKAYIENY